MKKLLLLMTLLIMSISNYAYDIAVKNADGVTIYYNYANEGKDLEVTDGNAPYSGVVNIPETVTYMNRTRNVTSIRGFTFYYSRDISSVTIPRSITFIGQKAFENCNSLTSVHISDITAWCKIIFEEPYTSNPLRYAHHLYMNGEEIQDLVIPNNVTSITDGAFYGCFGLNSATIPEGVSKIGESAFDECRNLKSISIPSSVKSIGRYAFSHNEKLSAVHISDIAAWCEIDFVGYHWWSNPLYYAHHLYVNEVEIRDLVIPDGVKSIGNFAFGGCSNLTSLTIPNSVSAIGSDAFEKCDIPTVISFVQNPFEISSGSFTQNTLKNATLYVPNEAIEKYKATKGWKDFLFVETITELNSKLFKLTYSVNDEEYKVHEMKYGSSISPETEPEREGYTFSGWSVIPETMPPHDVTVTGSFSVNSYTLTYMVDGEVYKTYEIEYGTTIIPEEAPTKTGYTFSGWADIPSTMPAKDVTLSGTFSINSYKLTYIIEGEEYKTFEIVYNSTITPEAEPTKEGHTFSGWSEIPETMPAYDVTVTGAFTVNTYTLIYMVDGEVYKTSEVNYGTTITPEAAPTKTGYSFSGWNNVPLTMPARDVTVSGTFTINSYKLTYIVDGEEYKSFEIVYDSAITPEAEPTKEGYTFSGWSDIPETMPANDVTVTGSFIVNKYQITYIIDGEVFATDYLEYGSTIVPPMVEEREGFTFSGWGDIPETMPAHDIVVHATYTSSIDEIIANHKSIRIYGPDGKPRKWVQKGLNIIVSDNGFTKKVFVK